MYNNTHTATKLNAEERATALFTRMTEFGPMGLMIGAALALMVAGAFQYRFYLLVIPAEWGGLSQQVLSVLIATAFECLAFFFLVTTVRDFGKGARKEGWIGSSATALLLAYSLFECHHIASAFDGNDPEKFLWIFGVLGTVIIIVRVVEFRIAVTVSSSLNRDNAVRDLSEKIGNLEKEILTLKGENFRLMSEKNERDEKELLEKQRIEREESDRKKRAEAARIKELERLAGLKSSGSIPGDKRKMILDKARQMQQENGKVPGKSELEKILNFSEGTVKYYFPNGSFQAALEAEISGNSQKEELSIHN